MFTVLVIIFSIFSALAMIGLYCLLNKDNIKLFVRLTPLYLLFAFLSACEFFEIDRDQYEEQLTERIVELERLKTTHEQQIMDAINHRLQCDTIATGSNGDILVLRVDSTIYIDKFVKQEFRLE